MFRKLLLCAVTTIFLTSTVIAEEKNPGLFNWTGIYVGVSGGHAWGSTRWTNNVGTTTGNFDTDGAILGLTAGYNFQPRGSSFVFGVEGDFSWADISGASTQCAPDPCTTTIDSLSSIRGRAGIAMNNTLLFLTGGVAIARIEHTNTLVNTQQTQVGWTFGGGIESALSRNWSAKVEYLYVAFDRSDVLFAAAGLFADFNDNHIVRGGINYRF